MSGQRLYAMLCVRARPDVREKLGKKLKKGGTLNDDAAYTIITYPTVSGAVAAVAALFASEPLAQEARFCLGITESRPEEFSGITATIIRALSSKAYPGQVLLTSAAVEVARSNLPARVSVKKLGDVLLESQISAELVYQMIGPGIAHDFPEIDGLFLFRSNVPAGEQIFGRDEELAQLRRLLLPGSLVSIVGPFGVGKTALAREAANKQQEIFRDGALWIDAARFQSGEDPFEFVNSELKLPHSADYSSSEKLISRLQNAQLLVVLDGCQGNAWIGLLEGIAEHCPDLCVLATSRSPLGVEQEVTVGLDPFPMIHQGAALETLENHPGVRFLHHLLGLEVDPTLLELFAEIVRRTGGLPIAMLLASGRLSEMQDGASIDDLLPPNLLRESIESLIEWSLSGLSQSEMQVLRHISVLRSHWSTDLVELFRSHLGRPAEETRQALSSLMLKRLVIPEPGYASRRFTLLPVIRQTLIDTLDGSKDVALAYALSAQELVKDQDSQTRASFDAIAREYHHIDYAIDLFNESDHSRSSELIKQLIDYWLRRGPYQKAFEQSKRAALNIHDACFDKAKMLQIAGTLAGYAGEYSEAENLLTEGASIFRSLKEVTAEASCIGNLAIHYRNSGDVKKATETLMHAMAILGPTPSRFKARIVSGYLTSLFEQGRIDEATAALEWARDEVYGPGDLWAIAAFEYTSSAIALAKGDSVSASDLLRSCIQHYRQVGDFQGLLCGLEKAAFLSLRHGQYSRAARILGATESGFISLRIVRAKDLTEERDRAIEEISDTLGFERTEHYITEGSLLKLDEVTDYATLN